MAITLGGEESSRSFRESWSICTKGRLYNFVCFVCGVLFTLVMLQIQAKFVHQIPLLSGTIFDPQATPHESKHKPSHKHTHTVTRKITLPASTTTVTVSASASPTPTPQTGNPPLGNPWSSMKQAFIFGDSYSANGFKPGGKQPNEKSPLGKGSNSGPPNWVQFLTTVHNASYIRSYDFAVGGSVVDRNVVTPYLLGTSLKEQYRNKFQPNYLGDKARDAWHADSTVFFMWYCVNDLYGSRSSKSNMKVTRTRDIMNSYEEVVGKLYADGARNMIFINCPPFERSTDDKLERKQNLTAQISSFNARMLEMRAELKRKHNDLNALIFDAHRLWSRVIDAPLDFQETKTVKDPAGICRPVAGSPPFPRKDPHSARCANGMVNEFVWYGLHGTFIMHNITAAHLASDCFGSKGPSGFCS